MASTHETRHGGRAYNDCSTTRTARRQRGRQARWRAVARGATATWRMYLDETRPSANPRFLLFIPRQSHGTHGHGLLYFFSNCPFALMFTRLIPDRSAGEGATKFVYHAHQENDPLNPRDCECPCPAPPAPSPGAPPHSLVLCLVTLKPLLGAERWAGCAHCRGVADSEP